MRVSFILISCIFFVTSCSTPEPKLKDYSVVLRNNSLETLKIAGYGQGLTEPAFNLDVASGDEVTICIYQFENFAGITCQSDSLVFRFPNNIGYTCALRENGVDFCFPDKSPFDQESFQKIDEDIFQFTITQQDFENAFELPD